MAFQISKAWSRKGYRFCLEHLSVCLSLSWEALYQSSATLRFSRRHHDEKRVEKWVREFTEESSPLASASLSVGAFG